jgi:putative MATE family efflux protein
MDTRFKSVLRYVIPSVGGLMVTFLYVVVDGIFVGRGIGADALAAVNLAFPFTMVLSALTAMITIGGATVTAIRLGRGEAHAANQAFMTSLTMAGAVSVLLMLAGVLLPEAIARISGASPRLVAPTAEYIRFYSLFTLASGMAFTLNAFVRNDGNPMLAFWGMVVGAVANIFLDWLFVFPLQMGIKGAAVASGVGQILSVALLSIHFFCKKGQLRICTTRLEPALVGKILKRGFPELITQLNTPVTVFCYNYVILKTLGEIGVSAYSVLGYITSLLVSVFLGVSEGVQPLIGQSYGAKDERSIRYFFRTGLLLNICLSTGLYVLFLVFGREIISIFNGDPQLIKIASGAMPIYGLSFLLSSLNLLITTYFFSTKQTAQAVVLSALRSVSLNILCIFLLPALLGAEFIWAGIVVSEALALLAGLVLKRHSSRREPFQAAAEGL